MTLERGLAVELYEGEVRASGFLRLVADERVETSDHILGQSAHRSRTVEKEPELGGLGNGRVSQCISFGQGWLGCANGPVSGITPERTGLFRYDNN